MPSPSIDPPGPGLAIWVIYDHPTDWPNHFVARRWVDERPTEDMVLAFDLDRLREFLAEHGFVCLARMEGDDPKIVETWL